MSGANEFQKLVYSGGSSNTYQVMDSTGGNMKPEELEERDSGFRESCAPTRSFTDSQNTSSVEGEHKSVGPFGQKVWIHWSSSWLFCRPFQTHVCMVEAWSPRLPPLTCTGQKPLFPPPPPLIQRTQQKLWSQMASNPSFIVGNL